MVWELYLGVGVQFLEDETPVMVIDFLAILVQNP